MNEHDIKERYHVENIEQFLFGEKKIIRKQMLINSCPCWAHLIYVLILQSNVYRRILIYSIYLMFSPLLYYYMHHTISAVNGMFFYSLAFLIFLSSSSSSLSILPVLLMSSLWFMRGSARLFVGPSPSSSSTSLLFYSPINLTTRVRPSDSRSQSAL